MVGFQKSYISSDEGRTLSAKIFGYYDNWRTEQLTCPTCGWTGTFNQGAVGYHDELMDSSCPACGFFSAPILAIVPYPTIGESESNWDKLSDKEKREVEARKRRIAYFQSVCLKDPNQLPDLSAPELVLTWDFEGNEDKEVFTTIKQEGTVIWREPACWEGYERYEVVLGVLKDKYGNRLRDLVPTEASGLIPLWRQTLDVRGC